jgi:hypothetical protein
MVANQNNELEAYYQLHTGYENTYYGTRLYRNVNDSQTSAAAPPSYDELQIMAHSPVEIMVTDPEGRQTGLDPITGKWPENIPNSMYINQPYDDPTGESAGAPQFKQVMIGSPISGEYTVRVVGTGIGEYHLSLLYLHSRTKVRVDSSTLSVPITIGEAHEYAITFDAAAPGPMPFTAGYSGGGQKPSDVNKFLRYVKPVESRNKLPAGTTFYDLIISYGTTTDPATFAADLDGVNVTNLFNARAGTTETVTIPLTAGSQTLRLSVDGLNDANRNTTDTDRLTFIVQ